MASEDAGQTWRSGAPTLDVSSWRGYQPSPIRIGSDGACYTAFSYQALPGAPIHELQLSNAPFSYAILQLPSNANVISKVPLAPSFSGNVFANDADTFAYTPAGNGMSARLVLYAFDSSPPWWSPSEDQLLIWHAAP